MGLMIWLLVYPMKALFLKVLRVSFKSSYGSSSGLSTSEVLADQIFQQGVGGLGDTAEFRDAFGSSLAAGDFNNDGFDDLAVGVPFENFAMVFLTQESFKSSTVHRQVCPHPAVLADQLFHFS